MYQKNNKKLKRKNCINKLPSFVGVAGVDERSIFSCVIIILLEWSTRIATRFVYISHATGTAAVRYFLTNFAFDSSATHDCLWTL